MKVGTKDAAIIARVLAGTNAEMQTKSQKAAGKSTNVAVNFAVSFNKFMGAEFVRELSPHFPGIISGETPSTGERGAKRVDVLYGSRESGLELMISFKSVHFGEEDQGRAKFTHNRKRNDEELRVEATEHHVRQPYSVLVAVVFLPMDACRDRVGPKGGASSSFASWVKYLWPLQDRAEPNDRPDTFELVFFGLYERDGSAFGFYEVRGTVPCPRFGPPAAVLSFEEFVARVRTVHERRNSNDFRFEGEK